MRGYGEVGGGGGEWRKCWERKVNLDHGALEKNESGYGLDGEMTISELMEWRYLMTEREKERVRALHLFLIENIELNINE